TLGLQVSYEDADTIFLRALEERNHHCLILRRGDEPVARELGFKVFCEEDLDRAEAFFKRKELPTEWVERPHQGRTLRTRDPFGLPLEFYHQMKRLEPIHQQYKRYQGVRPLRIDHF